MDSFWERPPFACMIEATEDLTPWLGGVFVASQFQGAGVLAARYAPPWRTQLEREGYKFFICLRSTNKRGIHAWVGQCLPLVFGTSGP